MKTEALLWSFSIRIDQEGNLILVKRKVPDKYIPKISRIIDLPQLKDIWEELTELSKDTETAIIRISQK